MTASTRPTWWGSLVLTPHRENPPRTQCRSCAGGGEINGVPCRDCGQRGYFDAQHPPRNSNTSEADYY
jgi:hypothetical protein